MSDKITFSCLSCGQHIACDASESGRGMLCPSCGANLTVPHKMDEMRAPEQTPQVPVPAPVVHRTSGLAVASLVCSLSSPILCIGWIPGIICGHLARSAIRRNPALTGKSLATAGLIISYATVIVTAGLTAIIIAMGMQNVMEAIEGSKDQELSDTNQPAYTQNTDDQTQSNSTEQAQSNGPGWTMDVKDAQIPADPVTGEIHGSTFECKRVIYRNGNLRFISTDGGEYLLIHGVGSSIENNSLEFQTASGDDAPKIDIGWKDQGQNQTENFQDGYAMELKFGGAKKRKIQGQIYLCLPDDAKSYLAGTFTVVLPKPKPAPQAAQ
ncbi:MAG TPA: DUF4190 domain-containing protein [Candidatus Sulfotelmatobacter sp.]|nr:DUF4190 domain-containing protein [Candidatus Sulfotelmatobacter sp.]